MTWLSLSALNLSVRLLTIIVRSDSPNLQVIFQLFLSRVINSIRSTYVQTRATLRNNYHGTRQVPAMGRQEAHHGVPSVTHGFLSLHHRHGCPRLLARYAWRWSACIYMILFTIPWSQSQGSHERWLSTAVLYLSPSLSIT